ncbi:MAG: hypothetical protein R2857_07890 [Vampirovibrionales bacterium]
MSGSRNRPPTAGRYEVDNNAWPLPWHCGRVEIWSKLAQNGLGGLPDFALTHTGLTHVAGPPDSGEAPLPLHGRHSMKTGHLDLFLGAKHGIGKDVLRSYFAGWFPCIGPAARPDRLANSAAPKNWANKSLRSGKGVMREIPALLVADTLRP